MTATTTVACSARFGSFMMSIALDRVWQKGGGAERLAQTKPASERPLACNRKRSENPAKERASIVRC